MVRKAEGIVIKFALVPSSELTRPVGDRRMRTIPQRVFFRAFRANFRQATVLWLILLGAGLALGLIALAVLIGAVHRTLTKKEVLLYTGYVNVAVGDTLDGLLTDGYVVSCGSDPKKQEVYAYAGLYLSDNPAAENHAYSYASRLKVMAAVNAAQLDVVLMNREAYDFLSGRGYLLDLEDVLIQGAPELYRRLAPYLTKYGVIVSDSRRRRLCSVRRIPKLYCFIGKLPIYN